MSTSIKCFAKCSLIFVWFWSGFTGQVESKIEQKSLKHRFASQKHRPSQQTRWHGTYTVIRIALLVFFAILLQIALDTYLFCIKSTPPEEKVWYASIYICEGGMYLRMALLITGALRVGGSTCMTRSMHSLNTSMCMRRCLYASAHMSTYAYTYAHAYSYTCMRT